MVSKCYCPNDGAALVEMHDAQGQAYWHCHWCDFKDCDFCDRAFPPDAAGTSRGISQRFRGDPADPDRVLMQSICDQCKEARPGGMWPEHLEQ